LVWLDRSSHPLLSSLLHSRHLQRWRNTVVVTAVVVEAPTVEVAAVAAFMAVAVAGSTAAEAQVSVAAVAAEVSVAAVVVEDSGALAEGAFVAAAAFVVGPRQAVSE
jgi:hypothetical protein